MMPPDMPTSSAAAESKWPNLLLVIGFPPPLIARLEGKLILTAMQSNGGNDTACEWIST
jgi:hypothetical protein